MAEKVIVTVKEGKVRGFKTKSRYSGVEYYSFLGVPYGQPTIGPARFKDPVKVKPWNNVLDANVEKEGCLQFSIVKKQIKGSEDCLYNNIFTPEIPSKGDCLKAVVVLIHPGGMVHGSPDPSYYGSPEYFMNRDIIYVSVSFRIHVLGLLNLNIKNCLGNQALKDIILSLKWIKENIHVFGGDPENITLMGVSSGSAFVHFLLLSPLATGLFHKAILAGMYAFNPLLVHSRNPFSAALEIATNMGYNGEPDESKKLLNFYRKLDFPRFITARLEKFYLKTTLPIFPTAPFIPSCDPNENSPLPLSPEKLIPSTIRVPILIGFCENEASMGIAMLRNETSMGPALLSSHDVISNLFYKAISQNCWGWGADLNDVELKQIQKEVEDFYLGGRSIGAASNRILCDILTDAALSDVYDSLINVISKDLPSSVYVYNFHYNGNLDFTKVKFNIVKKIELEGASHSADFGYWCYMEKLAGKHMELIEPNDREIIDTFTNVVTTFAKTSNPNFEGINVDWKPTTPENPSHLIINKKLEVRDEVLNGERLEFWHKLKRKFEK